jgi:2-polyprenyl-6-methoxyphenol hydroxylase-like FAD-dependent oxidoreductase
MMRYDVVIVGAGIGGAVLALDLGARGWRVAVVERESAAPRVARPEILWEATPRALERYGVADAIRETASVRIEEIVIGDEKPWLSITRDDFAAAGTGAFSTNPSMTRTILAGAAVATGNVEIHRGVSVEGLQRDGDRVTGVHARRGEESLTLEASLVVGDDGASSVVRAQLGIPIALHLFPVDLVTAVLARWPLEGNRVRVWIRRKGFRDGLPAAAFFPWPANEGVLLLPLPADRAKHFFEQPAEVFWSALDRVTPMSGPVREQLQFPRDFRRVTRPFGHAASYVAAGAALIGDAAHPMTPAGGQGANAAIHDALALAGVADAALRSGDVSRERLLLYEQLRRPFNDKSLSFSRAAYRAFRVGRVLPMVTTLFPALAGTIQVLRWPKRRIIGSVATAFAQPREEAS